MNGEILKQRARRAELWHERVKEYTEDRDSYVPVIDIPEELLGYAIEDIIRYSRSGDNGIHDGGNLAFFNGTYIHRGLLIEELSRHGADHDILRIDVLDFSTSSRTIERKGISSRDLSRLREQGYDIKKISSAYGCVSTEWNTPPSNPLDDPKLDLSIGIAPEVFGTYGENHVLKFNDQLGIDEYRANKPGIEDRLTSIDSYTHPQVDVLNPNKAVDILVGIVQNCIVEWGMPLGDMRKHFQPSYPAISKKLN